jgi:hypothetical protein
MIAIEFNIGSDEKVLFRSSDYRGYELCWKRTQKGEQVWTPERYHATIEQALQRVMELKVSAGNIRTLAELRTAIEKARSEIVDTYQMRLAVAG